MPGMARRISLFDLLFTIAFLGVGLTVWIQSRPRPIGPLLAAQAKLIDQAEAAEANLPFLPPPASPEEAQALSQQWQQFLKGNGPETWTVLQQTIAKRGKPATVTAFSDNWKAYRDAIASFEKALSALALPDDPAQPGIEAKRTEDYVARYNDFKAADDALTEWIARLSIDDFN